MDRSLSTKETRATVAEPIWQALETRNDRNMCYGAGGVFQAFQGSPALLHLRHLVHCCTAALLGGLFRMKNEKAEEMQRPACYSLLGPNSNRTGRIIGNVKKHEIYLRHCAPLAKVKIKLSGTYFRVKRPPIVCA